MKTCESMNREICGILRISGRTPNLYAAVRIEELEAENERLREALEFYAAKDMYRHYEAIIRDSGERARDALEGDK